MPAPTVQSLQRLNEPSNETTTHPGLEFQLPSSQSIWKSLLLPAKDIYTCAKNTQSQQKSLQLQQTDITPPQENENEKTHNLFVTMQDKKDLNRSFSDQTG